MRQVLEILIENILTIVMDIVQCLNQKLSLKIGKSFSHPLSKNKPQIWRVWAYMDKKWLM